MVLGRAIVSFLELVVERVDGRNLAHPPLHVVTQRLVHALVEARLLILAQEPAGVRQGTHSACHCSMELLSNSLGMKKARSKLAWVCGCPR